MFRIHKSYQTKIPPVTEDHPLWVMSLGFMTRQFTHYWKFNGSERLATQFDFKDKVVCVLGSGNGFLGHIAEIHGAEKIIGYEKEFWAVVYTRGLYPNWDIRWEDYKELESLPAADIYLYDEAWNAFQKDMDTFHEKHKRAFKEMERING